MAITYQTEGIKMPDIKKRETTEWIKAVAATYEKRIGEIAYIFCSDEKILEVNRQYPVSYTHLDVYKRQSKDFMTFDSGDITNVNSLSHNLPVSFSQKLCKLTITISPTGFPSNTITNCTGVYLSLIHISG